jgi:hypothetical protein
MTMKDRGLANGATRTTALDPNNNNNNNNAVPPPDPAEKTSKKCSGSFRGSTRTATAA